MHSTNITTPMLAWLGIMACCWPHAARSQTPGQPPAASPAPVPQPPPQTDVSGYFDTWFARVNEAQASQPHWMTPVATVTPRLEEEVRYDQFWESRGNGSTLDVYDGGKGLELIPTETNELLINPPAYQFKGNTAHPANGWLDDQFLVVKQRLLSANEENGKALPVFQGGGEP